MRLNWKKILGSAVAFAAFTVVNGCDTFNGDSKSIRAMLGARKSIRVASVQNAFTYQNNKGEIQGLEADLLLNFASTAGLQIVWTLYPNQKAAAQSVSLGQNDLAALHRSGSMKAPLWAGPSYQDSETIVICPKTVQTREVVLAEAHDSPELRFELAAEGWNILTSSQLPLNKLFKATLKSNRPFCVVTEEDEAKFELRYFLSDLSIQKKLTLNRPLRFWVHKQDPQLLQALFVWNLKISRDQTLARIREHYERPLTTLTTSDLNLFFNSQGATFAPFESFFREAAHDHQLPWQLIAAVSFQESHWDSEARSPTGVRGLMQLTEEAAEHMGITDRRDPEQNVWGGAKYLKYLFQSQPTHLTSRQRLTLTLAAYNIGQGHLQDAQKLAVRLGKNPFAWRDLREVLPLLANERWSRNLEYGPARGQEAVNFSERVLAYYDLLLNRH